MLRMLVEKGARVNSPPDPNGLGGTLILIAGLESGSEIIRALLDAGADPGYGRKDPDSARRFFLNSILNGNGNIPDAEKKELATYFQNMVEKWDKEAPAAGKSHAEMLETKREAPTKSDGRGASPR